MAYIFWGFWILFAVAVWKSDTLGTIRRGSKGKPRFFLSHEEDEDHRIKIDIEGGRAKNVSISGDRRSVIIEIEE